MKKQFYFILLLLTIGLGLSRKLQADITTFPYVTGFETTADTVGWEFSNIFYATQHTQWTIDSAEFHLGHRGLYVSNDSGATTKYNGTASGYIIHAYQTFTFPATAVATDYALAFDWKCQGHYAAASDGTINVGDAFAVSLVPDATTIRPAITGTDYPTYVKTNRVAITGGTTEFYGSTQWNQALGTFNVPATGGTYKLLFTWRMGGGVNGNLGACIDDVQVSKKPLDTDCEASPTNLKLSLTPTDLLFSWTGTGTTYQLSYFSAMDPSSAVTINNITGTSFTVSRTSIPEGIYSFRVRSNCGTSHSFWIDYPKALLVYDASGYCLDYLNFAAAGVTCGTGTSSDHQAFKNIGYVDHGYGSEESQQTVHYVTGENDPVVESLGGFLPTKPDGALASVRCGNHLSPTAEGIRYKFHVGPDDGILVFKYTVVVQSGSHTRAEQPYFQLRIMNNAGVDLDAACTSPAFYAPTHTSDVVPGDGWKFNPSIGDDPLDGSSGQIFWRDWTTVGLNLAPYLGQDIQIEVTTYDCIYSVHFGYCYFTMACATGDIQGVTCGVHPSEFTVDEGFNYRWYKDSDPSTTLGTDRTFSLTDPNDTSLYHVDMISKTNSACYFTLNAWALPRFPSPRYTETRRVHDCSTDIHLVNTSKVIGLWDDDGIADDGDTISTGEDCDEIMWKINGLTSYKLDTTLSVPGAGDTIYLELHATLNGGCEEVLYDTLYVPSILPKATLDTITLCDNELPYNYKGIVITAGGNYADTIVTSNGCDSISGIRAEVHKTYDLTSDPDTICFGDSLNLSGLWVKTSGTYENRAKTIYGCDSIVHQPVVVLPELSFNAVGMAENVPNGGSIVITPIATDLKTKPFEVYVDYDLKDGTEITTATDNVTTVTNMTGGTYKVWLQQGACTSDTMLIVIDRVCLEVSHVMMPEVCGDCGSFNIPYTIEGGNLQHIFVTFNDTAKLAGFKDFDLALPDGTTSGDVVVTLPTPIKPNHYALSVLFTDSVCPALDYDFHFDVLYPSSIIAQRWNDVLGLNNNSSDASDAKGSSNVKGGYDISKVEWYMDGVTTDITSPIYYIAGQDLDSSSEYRVELTRRDDNVTVMSCGLTPKKYTESELNVSLTLVLRSSINKVSAPSPGIARIYSTTGLLISTDKIVTGENDLRMPSEPGYYILHIELTDGTVSNYSINVIE